MNADQPLTPLALLASRLNAVVVEAQDAGPEALPPELACAIEAVDDLALLIALGHADKAAAALAQLTAPIHLEAARAAGS